MEEKHVVIGAAGALGSAIVAFLASKGKSVRAVVRDLDRARRILPPSADIAIGDGSHAESVRLVCRNATVIYHCVNVPFEDWDSVMPGVTDNILAGARESKARLVFPGNVYGYGPLRATPATEDHPLMANSKKGQLRNDVERKLIDANLMADVKVVIPRFPEFYGPNVKNWLMTPVFQAALDGRTASWPGKLDVPHDLIYIDDAAAACCILGSSEPCYGQVWHVPGAGPVTGKQFIGMAFEAAGTKARMKAITRGSLRVKGVFGSEAREMIELIYGFEQPMVLDGSKFAGAFPSFRYTTHEHAIRQTGNWYGQHLDARR